MEWSAAKKIMNAEEEVKNANYPNIRFFQVNKAGSNYRQDNCDAKWEVCTPSTMMHFSAVAYFFARHLQQNMDVPVGLINASWGGTPAEVWVKNEMVETDPIMSTSAQKLRRFDWWPKEPGSVYNAMIAPLVPFRIAGALWYQGEGNVDNSESYAKLFRTLIESWRTDFGTEFPFYYVQIAPYNYGVKSHSTLIREAQAQCQEIPGAGMVVVSDLVDNIRDIHPLNKQDVGKRLANMALSENYKVPGLIYKFPQYKMSALEKGKIRIQFINSEEGLILKGGDKPLTFEVAGEDKNFVPAVAKIEGNTIVVWAKSIKSPVAVRYSFKNDAIGNVFSKEGLPLAPFRTDKW
jgi:sialate O-acetylesterase